MSLVVDASGAPAKLVAMVMGKQSSIDVSFLNLAPVHALPTALALVASHKVKSLNTLVISVKQFRRYWIPFLMETGGLGGAIAQLTKKDFLAFKMWLDSFKPPCGSTKARSATLLTVQRVLAVSGELDSAARYRGGYPGSHRATTARLTPKPDDAAVTIRIASREVLKIVALHDAMADEAKRCELVTSDRRIVEAATWLQDRSYGQTLGLKACRSAGTGHRRPWLGPLAGLSQADRSRAADLVWPTARALAPIGFLISVYFRLDGQTLADVRMPQVAAAGENRFIVVDTFGEPRLRLDVVKRRGKTVQHPSYPVDAEPDGPAALLEFLERWTANLRRMASRDIADCLFLCLGGRHHQRVSKLTTSTIIEALAGFCGQVGVPVLTSSLAKRIAIDVVDEASGGNTSMRVAIGGHGLQVSEVSYRSDAASQRSNELLATTMIARERRLKMNGRADPRDQLPGDHMPSATPGWRCHDPYSSPLPWMRPNKLCDGYGRCPACPMVDVEYDSPYAFARAVALLLMITDAAAIIPIASWWGIWRPIAMEIRNRHLPAFSGDARSKGMKIELPPMLGIDW